MRPFEKCPVCGNEMVAKKVEKLLRGGNNTAVLKIQADVCLRCGERLYSQQTVRNFEQIRDKLAREQTKDFRNRSQNFFIKNSKC